MFGRGISLFKLAGFTVKVDTSWVFIALLVTWSLAQGYFPGIYEGLSATTYWSMGVVALIGLFMSIVLHELSHSIVARQFGLPIEGITLFIFGGVAHMEREPAEPKTEFYMAIAGPIASILLSGLFFALAHIITTLGWPQPVHGIARYLFLLNGMLALFNLVPAFPLDGGRVLRALLWWRTGDFRWATMWAVRSGNAFGTALMLLGVLAILGGGFITGLWWFLLGMFLKEAALGSRRQVLLRHVLEGEPISHFMNDKPITVGPRTTVQSFVDDHVYRYNHPMFPVVETGRLVGYMSIDEVKAVPRENWDRTAVADVMLAIGETNAIDAGADSMEVLRLMQKHDRSRLLVTENSTLVGVVALKDLIKMFSIKTDLEETA